VIASLTSSSSFTLLALDTLGTSVAIVSSQALVTSVSFMALNTAFTVLGATRDGSFLRRLETITFIFLAASPSFAGLGVNLTNFFISCGC